MVSLAKTASFRNKLLFLLITIMMFESAYSSTSTSYDNDDWVSTLNSSSKKWCRYSSTTSYGYIWDKTNSSSYCGGYSYSRCSDDGSYYLPQNAKKLLCPTDSYYCSSSQSTSLYYSTSTAYFYSYSIPTSRVCWYKITPTSSYISSIKIEITSLSKASAEVYLESTTNTFTYKGSLSNGDDLTVSATSYDPIWVLITPTSNYASASIKASASSSSSSSSSSSDYSTTDTSTIMIAVFTSVGGFIVLIVIFLVICRCIHLQKQRNFHLQNANAAARVLNTHQPAIAYNQYAVYQQNQNNFAQMNHPPAPSQRIYVHEPSCAQSVLDPAMPVPGYETYPAQPVVVQTGVPINQTPRHSNVM